MKEKNLQTAANSANTLLVADVQGAAVKGETLT